MKFGRQGILILFLLGALALLMAIFSPALLTSSKVMADSQSQTSTGWKHAAKGVVESISTVAISSQITGNIKSVMCDEGEQVSAGQPMISFAETKMLARLALAKAAIRQSEAYLALLENGSRSEDVDAARSVVERMQAIFAEARDEMVRMQQLARSGAVTETDRQRAERDHAISQAQLSEASANLKKLTHGPRKEELAAARADLDKTRAEQEFVQASLGDYTILSPIDGLVIKRSAEVGETVDVGTPLFTIIDPEHLRVVAELEETDAGKVVKGQNVTVEVEAAAGKKITGKVVQVFNTVQKKQQKAFDPIASFDINTQKIHIQLDDYSGLVHGLTVTVVFNQ